MTTKRLYRVKYLQRDISDTVFSGRERTEKLTVEVVSAFAACVVGEKAAKRACAAAIDEKFVRVVAVKEIGAVARG